MEGNKNAMYAQAGRSRGWTQSVNEEMAVKAVPVPMAAEKVVSEVAVNLEANMAVEKVMPSIPVPPVMPLIPAPPVVPSIPVPPVVPLIPAPPVVKAPEAEKFGEECQAHAMAFVKMQKWHEIYDTEQGFTRGTLFAGLDLPFVGEGACNRE